VVLVEPEVFDDDRGYLLETYDAERFAEAGIDHECALSFYSQSKQRVLRGLHMQTVPAAQSKIVHCSRGKIFDVAVDVRDGSTTYGEYVSTRLSGEDKRELYIPEGFLHGYLVLSDTALVHYKSSHPYAPEHERGVIWNDPDIDIDWPLDGDPILSEKDTAWPTLGSLESNN
jgi:dTDP-4-dehydrorhamnose 3,5-epimerase